MAYSRSPSYGGTGGNAFSDNLTETTQLIGINISAGGVVDSIQGVFSTTAGSSVTGPKYGGGGGTPQVIKLDQGDVIVRVEGRYGDSLDQVEFFTANGAHYGPYGGDGGKPFTISGVKVGGFFGRAGDQIDQFGIFTLFTG